MAVKPVRPGTYITITGQQTAVAPVGGNEIAAVPIQHDWGPVGLGKPCSTVFDFENVYGASQTDGRQAVYEALIGAQGSGAGAVLPYRLGGSGGASATKALNNTSAALAITLTAKYPGVRGNRYIPVVIDYAPDATRNVLQIYLDTYAGDPLESYIHLDGDIAGLVAQINSLSQIFTATSAATSAPLALSSSPTAATGGVDPTPSGSDYTTCLNALSVADFSVLAFQNLVSSSIQASVLTWVQQMASRQTPVTWIVGGDTTDTLASALTRTAALTDPNVINLGIGQYTDDYKKGALVSTAQLAPRIAGALIGRGDARSLTFTKLDGLHAPVAGSAATPPPSLTEIEQAIQNGVTVFSRSLSADADLKIEKGLTTFTSTTDPQRPFDIYSDPRLVRLTNAFLKGLKVWGDDNIIGGAPVTDNLRSSVRIEVTRRIAVMVGRGLINPGTASVEVHAPSDPNLADAIPFDFGWQYSRTANYLLGNGRVR